MRTGAFSLSKVCREGPCLGTSEDPNGRRLTIKGTVMGHYTRYWSRDGTQRTDSEGKRWGLETLQDDDG